MKNQNLDISDAAKSYDTRKEYVDSLKELSKLETKFKNDGYSEEEASYMMRLKIKIGYLESRMALEENK